ncbi:MAG: rod shape-determining protein MreC [Holophagales bacterium]|nr:rod shape-determining protein MreC [Holophagales bacterium]
MSERWHRLVLVLLLLGHLALLSIHPRHRGAPLESWLLGIFGPVVGTVDGAVDTLRDLAGSWRLAGSLRAENQRLRAEVAEMRHELVRLYGVEEELDRLASLSSYARVAGGDSFVADVVYLDQRSWLETLVVHTGSERARIDQAVVNEHGLVGRVVAVSGRYAKVQLITDRAASASAMIPRTRRQGLTRGAGDHLVLDNFPERSDVRIGDRVITAGLDGVFPRGLSLGVVRTVGTGQGMFRLIRLEPAVDFGLLDQVYLLATDPMPDDSSQELIESEEVGGGGGS